MLVAPVAFERVERVERADAVDFLEPADVVDFFDRVLLLLVDLNDFVEMEPLNEALSARVISI